MNILLGKQSGSVLTLLTVLIILILHATSFTELGAFPDFEWILNNGPVFTAGEDPTRTIAENTASGENIGTPVSATDADNDPLTYTLSGTDAAAFRIDSTTGQLQTKAALDYETKATYTVMVTVSDGNGGSDSITLTVNVTDANDAPIFTEGITATRTVAEHTASGENIGEPIAATDADDDPLTYTLGGTDAAAFRILSTSGQLQTRAALDYETKASYTVLITVSDGKGGSDGITVTISVQDVDGRPPGTPNRAPVFIEGASATRTVAENTATNTNIGSPISATDADNDTLTYTLDGNPDAAAFSIVSTSGALRTRAVLDYETQSSYTVNVSVSDGNGGTDRITVTINVTDGTERTYPLYGRTRQVQEAIVAAVGVHSPAAVTAAHLADITRLDIDNKGIAALKAGDFNGLTALQSLNLSDNSIKHISAIRNLTKLEYLNLSNNSISDISPIRNLTELEYLSLSGNSISDISAVENMTALGELSLWGNSISDISPIGNLTRLTALYLSRNSISDISALEHLTELKLINLPHNSISDISAIGNLTKLTWLMLQDNSISDISAVENLTALTHLGLWSNSISDISAIGNLTKLTWLTLQDNSISDISAIENLTALTYLYLRHNPISDYGPLRSLQTANPALTIDISLDNNPPVFADGDSTTRSIEENTAANTNIGAAVAATDADSEDTLTYTLGGTDAESFRIVETSGQLQTEAALDFETKNTYTVTVTVYDGNSGGDSITVTITVTDVAGAAPSVETPPVIPKTTALLTNFPNPFNPETWIPYHLAKDANVTLTIYDIRGVVVRELWLGHQPAGVYESRGRAAYWDGKNQSGEPVASGLYFYTLTAGEFTATRKLLIAK